VNVPVPLLAAQRENVHPLGVHFLPHGFSDAINHPLETQVLLERKVTRHLLAVLSWRDQRVAVQRWIPVEKDNSRAILVNDAMMFLRIPGYNLADETGASLATLDIGFYIERLTFRHGYLQ
jgi:hypothetical protein